MTTLEMNNSFTLAYNYVCYTNKPIFLTGKAGTGKTTFLKYLKDNCPKNMAVAAPTGVAAINAGGVTLNSLFQIPPSSFYPGRLPAFSNSNMLDVYSLTSKARLDNNKLKLIRSLELLIIDEVSMVRADMLDAVNTMLQFVRRNTLPFGGVQVLFIGDLFQLPPVTKPEDWQLLQEIYKSPYFFDSKVLEQVQLINIELDKIYRQQDDTFINLLNAVRNNNPTNDTFDLLNKQYQPNTDLNGIITLTTHNANAARINENNLQRLTTKAFVYKAKVSGDINTQNLLAEESLALKVGAQVMFVKNSSDKQYYNGMIATVKYLDADTIKVEHDNEIITVPLDEWRNVRYTLDEGKDKINENIIGSFEQYPLRLAWAVTIHKSQGLTFDKCAIDAADCFAGGQLYVALSRCRTLQGIILLTKVPQRAIITDNNIVTYYKSINNVEHQSKLANEQQQYLLQLVKNLYLFTDELNGLAQLYKLYQDNHNELNTNAQDQIEQWQSIVNNYNTIGLKFSNELNALAANEATVWLPRVAKANTYFTTQVKQLLQLIEEHKIITESRPLAKDIDAILINIHKLLQVKIQFYQGLQQELSLNAYFIQRRNLELTLLKTSSYAQKKQTGNVIYKIDVANPSLYLELAAIRNELCDETGQPIYMIANKEMLADMATYLPSTKQDLLRIKGFGKAKVDRFGADFLEAINDYRRTNNLESNMPTTASKAKSIKAEKEPKEPKPIKDKNELHGTFLETYELYKSGLNIEAIAAQRNFVPSTIYSHLGKAIKLGKLALIDVIDGMRGLELLQLVADNNGKTLVELKAIANDKFSFDELRLAMAQADRNNAGN
jgi:hypothetical protein